MHKAALNTPRNDKLTAEFGDPKKSAVSFVWQESSRSQCHGRAAVLVGRCGPQPRARTRAVRGEPLMLDGADQPSSSGAGCFCPRPRASGAAPGGVRGDAPRIDWIFADAKKCEFRAWGPQEIRHGTRQVSQSNQLRRHSRRTVAPYGGLFAVARNFKEIDLITYSNPPAQIASLIGRHCPCDYRPR
ncbi:hypothetical protein PEP31012_00105 [Pandoraea eparura]|uniref:Uncharacterized protein n=1 Tax=Pandoraea eparura TaxID=2508291 RepID=A0A5E4RGL6_9BURK|nr:hypothetical protein PEP31012_00105 [Pandoraea eparura]